MNCTCSPLHPCNPALFSKLLLLFCSTESFYPFCDKTEKGKRNFCLNLSFRVTNFPLPLCLRVDPKNKMVMYSVNLPFYGQPKRLKENPDVYNAIAGFLRSDHLPFWNSFPSLSAIHLSDTADHRGYMVTCYHKNCDSVSKVTPEMLQFLQKTTDSIVAVTNDVTKLSYSPIKGEGRTARLSQTTGGLD